MILRVILLYSLYPPDDIGRYKLLLYLILPPVCYRNATRSQMARTVGETGLSPPGISHALR